MVATLLLLLLKVTLEGMTLCPLMLCRLQCFLQCFLAFSACFCRNPLLQFFLCCHYLRFFSSFCRRPCCLFFCLLLLLLQCVFLRVHGRLLWLPLLLPP